MIEDLWCRVEEEGGTVSRVNVMHPSGEILFSFPPEHFGPDLVRRMRAGQVRSRLSEDGRDGGPLLSFLDETGREISAEDVPRRSIGEPRDGEER